MIVTYIQEGHNHEILDESLTFMLLGHRKMNSVIINTMNMMLKVGIKTPQTYSSFVHTVDGFQNMEFFKRDMYNQIDKQQRLVGGDAMACLSTWTQQRKRAHECSCDTWQTMRSIGPHFLVRQL
ncbi:hypothetical protein S83_015922 [Arachis hypogaea]